MMGMGIPSLTVPISHTAPPLLGMKQRAHRGVGCMGLFGYGASNSFVEYKCQFRDVRHFRKADLLDTVEDNPHRIRI